MTFHGFIWNLNRRKGGKRIMQQNNHNDDDNDNRRRKIIIMIIVIIIIILLLLTSCTSKFWGRIGFPFMQETEVKIDDDTNDKEIILNQNLKFDAEQYQFYLGEEDGKLTYYYQQIHPKKFTCKTSDSKIATCVVKNGYVVLKVKKKGKVTVTLDTATNGKIYRATTKVTIKASQRYITLSSQSGTIYLSGNRSLYVSYFVGGTAGKVSAKVSDSSIASVTVEEGRIHIVGKKKGHVTVTVTVTDNYGSYSTTYELTITDQNPQASSSKTSSSASASQKSHDSALKSLKTNQGKLSFQSQVHDYYLSVENQVDHVTLEAIPHSSKAKVQYRYNGKTVSSLEDLALKVGTNEVTILVTAEDGSTTTYTVTIERSARTPVKDNALGQLTVSEGTLTPRFDPDVLNYQVTVDADVDHIDMNAVPKEKNAKVQYRYRGQEVSDLKDLPLQTGQNEVEIVVTDDDGNTRTYTVTIDKQKSTNNQLKDLTASSGTFQEKFEPQNKTYHLEIPYDEESLTLQAVLADARSTVTYQVDGKTVSSLEDLNLEAGDHTIEITVTSEDNVKNTYILYVHKKKRTLQFDNENYQFSTNNRHSIPYTVYEDNLPLEAEDYQEEDVVVTWEGGTFSGTVEVHQGYIEVIPDSEMDGKKLTFSATYHGETAQAEVTFKASNYYLTTPTNHYDVDQTSEQSNRNLVFYNNFFSQPENVRWKPLEDAKGIRIYEEGNEDVYIDLYFDSDQFTVQDVTGSHSLNVVLETKKSGTLRAKGYVYGEEVSDVEITIQVTQKYLLTLDANGGYFDLFTTTYTFQLGKEDMPFDLTEYIQGYLEDENCLHYALIGFSKDKTSKTVEYDTTITIQEDTILYAVYQQTPSEEPVLEEKNLYLTDVDLFHNEEYFQLYNRDKIIYPGAFGSYRMELVNNSSQTIEIKSITLEEETICMNEQDCLNMGYIIKDLNQYYFGNSNDQYVILHRHAKTEKTGNLTKNVIEVPLTIPQNEKKEISLLWKWVDTDNLVDTFIGNQAKQSDVNYRLTVSIQFTTTKTACENGG